MMKVSTRNDFPQLLTSMGLTGNAVEIGVADGGFSHHILDNWKGRMYQVDPWALLKTPGFSGHGEDTEVGMQARFERIQKAALRYNKVGQQPRCIPMRMTSEQAAKKFADGFFDFVYIDASHNYDSIKQDIDLWHRTVKSGGVFAGHDAIQGWKAGTEYGVLQAVTEFTEKHGLKFQLTQESDYPSFWIVKP